MVTITELIDRVRVRCPASRLGGGRTAESMYLGTSAHARISRHIKGTEREREEDSIEFRQYLQFRADHPEWTFDPAFSERKIKWGAVKGRMDAGLTRPDGTRVVVEWKRSNADSEVFGAKPMRAPLRHLLSTPTNLWGLELAMQAVLLERGEGVPTSGFIAVVFHPGRPKYQIFPMRDLRPEALLLITRAFERIKRPVKAKRRKI